MLDFVKTTPLKIEQVSLLPLLSRVKESQSIPEGIRVVLPENDVVIECDYRKIEVLLINLLKNAIDAVKTQGEIKIRLTELDSDVIIEVEDSGPGIPEESMAKIFDPLFTTKQKGTGLGLSSVKNIVMEHGGTITVSNDPTTFTVKIPKKPKTHSSSEQKK